MEYKFGDSSTIFISQASKISCQQITKDKMKFWREQIAFGKSTTQPFKEGGR